MHAFSFFQVLHAENNNRMHSFKEVQLLSVASMLMCLNACKDFLCTCSSYTHILTPSRTPVTSTPLDSNDCIVLISPSLAAVPI